MNEDNRDTLDLVDESAEGNEEATEKKTDKKAVWLSVGIVGAVIGILALLSTAIFMIVSSGKPSVEPSEPVSSIVAVSSEEESEPEVSSEEVSSEEEVSSKTVSSKPAEKPKAVPTFQKERLSPALCNYVKKAPTDNPKSIFFVDHIVDGFDSAIFEYKIADKSKTRILANNSVIHYDSNTNGYFADRYPNFHVGDEGILYYCIEDSNTDGFKWVSRNGGEPVTLATVPSPTYVPRRADNANVMVCVEQNAYEPAVPCIIYHILPTGEVNTFTLIQSSMPSDFSGRDEIVLIAANEKYIYFEAAASNYPTLYRLDVSNGSVTALFKSATHYENFYFQNGWIFAPEENQTILYNENTKQKISVANFNLSNEYFVSALHIAADGTTIAMRGPSKESECKQLYRISPNGTVTTNPVRIFTGAVSNGKTVFIRDVSKGLVATNFTDNKEITISTDYAYGLQLHGNWLYFVNDANSFLYRVNVNDLTNIIQVTDVPVTETYGVLF